MLVLVVGGFYTYLAYEKAKQKNRRSLRWALIALGTFIGTQILVAGSIGFILGFGEEHWGWSGNLFEKHEIHITIASLLASAFANWLALRPLNRIPNEYFSEPPLPPTFEQGKFN